MVGSVPVNQPIMLRFPVHVSCIKWASVYWTSSQAQRCPMHYELQTDRDIDSAISSRCETNRNLETGTGKDGNRSWRLRAYLSSTCQLSDFRPISSYLRIPSLPSLAKQAGNCCCCFYCYKKAGENAHRTAELLGITVVVSVARANASRIWPTLLELMRLCSWLGS